MTLPDQSQMENSFVGLREFIELIDDVGELEQISGADWELEMSALSELVCKGSRDPPPALMFDEVPGYPPNYRTLFGMTNSANRLAIAVEMEPGYDHPLEFIKDYREHSENVVQGGVIEPEFVSTSESPTFENTKTNRDEIDLLSLPVPRFQNNDGGRYIGTADCVITRNPESGNINVGTYRMQVFSENQVGVLIAPGHHGRRHIEAYHDRGEPAPVAAVYGMDPTLWMFSSFGLNHDNEYGEYEYAAGLKGQPFPVVEGPETGLPLPARAEIAVEGAIEPEKTETEGPFGETFGYYGSDPAPGPVLDVSGFYHRNDPILTCAAPAKPPYDYSLHKSLTRSANLWNQIEGAGVPGVTGVWRTEEGGARLLNVISIDQEYAGHAKQAGHIAAHTQAGGQANRWTIVVDDDVDPTNLSEVFWAMSTRCRLDEDIEILQNGWGTPVDPLAENKVHPTNARAIVDATIPYADRETFPEVVEHDQEFLADVADKWSEIIERRN